MSSKARRIGNHHWHQGEGSPNNLQVWPMSREDPKARINRQSIASVAFPSAQTRQRGTRASSTHQNAVLSLQISTLCIEIHVMQVGAWEKLRGLNEDTWG